MSLSQNFFDSGCVKVAKAFAAEAMNDYDAVAEWCQRTLMPPGAIARER